MFHLEDAPLVERFELALFSVRTPAGTMRVPVVDGWIELQMALLRVPEAQESRAFFAALGRLRAVLREMRPGMRWYFLHKPPGLKLRFRVGMPDSALLEKLIGTVLGWRLPWLRAAGLGSVFDQAELLPAVFRTDAERLLSLAADEYLAAAVAGRHCPEEAWSDFLIGLLGRLGLDTWLAHEALARLLRLRSVDLANRDAIAEPPLDPSGMLAAPLGELTPGFAASVSALQTLNLTFNIWGIDAAAQTRNLERACAATRPSLMSIADA